MSGRSIGFIGGGRVTRILLGGLERAGASPQRCVVSDTDAEVLGALEARFPFVTAVGDDLDSAAGQEVVFGALHPPALRQALPRIGPRLDAGALFVSLAPVIRIPALRAALGGFGRVARMIPNAPSLVGAGFNPVAFAPGLEAYARRELVAWLGVLGECPEVPDDQLEAFAVLTAMGPTYFWYQFDELQRLGREFGLEERTVRHALRSMLDGGVRTFFDSGLEAEQVADLVPVKPLRASEQWLREAYRSGLGELYAKLTGRPVGVAS